MANHQWQYMIYVREFSFLVCSKQDTRNSQENLTVYRFLQRIRHNEVVLHSKRHVTHDRQFESF